MKLVVLLLATVAALLLTAGVRANPVQSGRTFPSGLELGSVLNVTCSSENSETHGVLAIDTTTNQLKVCRSDGIWISTSGSGGGGVSQGVLDALSASYCHGRGVFDGESGVCQCYNSPSLGYYTGPRCEECADGYTADDDYSHIDPLLQSIVKVSVSCKTDIDECALNSTICGSSGFCFNTPGSYYCSCDLGFAGSTCTPCEGTTGRNEDGSACVECASLGLYAWHGECIDTETYGLSSSNPGTSCVDIQQLHFLAGSSNLTVGDVPVWMRSEVSVLSPIFETLCDFSTLGGGWTLVMRDFTDNKLPIHNTYVADSTMIGTLDFYNPGSQSYFKIDSSVVGRTAPGAQIIFRSTNVGVNVTGWSPVGQPWIGYMDDYSLEAFSGTNKDNCDGAYITTNSGCDVTSVPLTYATRVDGPWTPTTFWFGDTHGASSVWYNQYCSYSPYLWHASSYSCSGNTLGSSPTTIKREILVRIDLDECDPNPCGTNADCLDRMAAYECICPLRYVGNPAVECVPCNSTQIPSEDGLSCINCPPGEIGVGNTCSSAFGITPELAVASCAVLQQLYLDNGSPVPPSGYYWVNPGGTAFKTECDFDSRGGGWTLVMRDTTASRLQIHNSYVADATELGAIEDTVPLASQGPFKADSSVLGAESGGEILFKGTNIGGTVSGYPAVGASYIGHVDNFNLVQFGGTDKNSCGPKTFSNSGCDSSGLTLAYSTNAGGPWNAGSYWFGDTNGSGGWYVQYCSLLPYLWHDLNYSCSSHGVGSTPTTIMRRIYVR